MNTRPLYPVLLDFQILPRKRGLPERAMTSSENPHVRLDLLAGGSSCLRSTAWVKPGRRLHVEHLGRCASGAPTLRVIPVIRSVTRSVLFRRPGGLRPLLFSGLLPRSEPLGSPLQKKADLPWEPGTFRRFAQE